MSRKYKNFVDGFWEKVSEVDGCWVWTGAERNRKHYGNYQGMLAHRVSWELHNKKEVPSGMLVMHSCDNPRCVRPSHLLVGTSKDNMVDMMLKGRKPTKLSWAIVDEIKSLYRSGVRQCDIAKQLALSRVAVCEVVIGRKWTAKDHIAA